jgi:NIMA (never in mitosis gene a)-related kinase
MKDLVNEGESPKEAGNVVSQAAAQAHQQGLKGKDLAAKVHEAVQQRKAQKDEAKKKERERIQKEEQERINKEKQERIQKEERERFQKENQERIQKMQKEAQ